MNLEILDLNLSVCRFEPDAPVPGWASESEFYSVTRTPDELSVVCMSSCVPAAVPPAPCEVEAGWSVLRVEGPLDFSLTGILSSLTAPLAEAGIAVFAVSTYDTDYLLVKKEDLRKTVEELSRTGFSCKYRANE